MKRIIKRILLIAVGVIVLGTAGLALAVAIRQHRTFDAPYPELHASADPAIVARGRYLVLGPAHCIECHAAPSDPLTAEDPPLVGGRTWDLPIGTVYSRNLTPDRATGIGRYSDPEVARILRFGVHPSGRAMMPFMPFAGMTDEDLVAVLSYLRSRPPVVNAVPESRYNLLGKFAKAFLLEPKGPTGAVPASLPRAPTSEYGKYLVTSVGNCVGCHTKRSLRTGEDLGTPLAGGMEMEHDGQTFVTPNLTPDPRTGHIFAWSEDVFVQRFKNAVPTASPMPWRAFRTMSEEDLRAIYRYLRSVPPAAPPT